MSQIPNETAHCSELTTEENQERTNALFAKNEQLRTEICQLRAWKESMLKVESEWDVQKLARLLGGVLGESCRAVIGKRVPELVAKCEKLEKDQPSLELLERAASALKYRIEKVGCDPNTYNDDGLGEVLRLGLENDEKAIEKIKAIIATKSKERPA